MVLSAASSMSAVTEPTAGRGDRVRPPVVQVATWAVWTLLLAMVLSLYLIHPSDAPFIADEPTLIAKALTANAAGRWETVGLTGTVGRPYGPVSTWFYQVLLARGLGPEGLVLGRAGFVALVTLFGLAWTAIEARLSRWGVLALLASPYLVFYARQLWDNSFNIPLAAVLMGATLAMVVNRRWWTMPVWVLTAGLMLLVHPMSVALIGPLGVWAAVGLVRNLPARLRSRRWLVPLGAMVASGVVVAVGVMAVPDYLAAARASTAPVQSRLSVGGWQAWAFAWLGFRNTTGLWFDYFFPQGYLPGWIGGLATVVAVAVGIGTLGILCVARRLPRLHAGPGTVFAIALSIVIAQMFLNAHTHTYGHPHYFNATWIGWACMAWAGAEALARSGRSGRVVAGLVLVVWLGGVVATNVGWLAAVHEHGGSRYDLGKGVPRGYGPTIGNQWAVAAARDMFAPESPIRLSQPSRIEDVTHYHLFAFSYDVVRAWRTKVQPATQPSGYKPFRPLDIRYVPSGDALSGKLEMVGQR